MMSSTRGSQKWEHGNISRASNGNDNNRERRIDATRYQLSAGRGRETTRSGPGRVGPSKRQLSQFWRRGTLHTGLCSRVSQSVFSGLLAKPWTLNSCSGAACAFTCSYRPGAWSAMISGQRLERGIPRLVAASRGLFLQSRVWGESFVSPRVGVWENGQG